MDGADVDAHIKKKRAHKSIMAETFNHNSQQDKLNRFKNLGKSRRGVVDRASSFSKSNSSSVPQTGDSQLQPDSAISPLYSNGYILQDGNVIPINKP